MSPDRRLRELERRAATGDLDAQTQVDVWRLRNEGSVLLAEWDYGRRTTLQGSWQRADHRLVLSLDPIRGLAPGSPEGVAGEPWVYQLDRDVRFHGAPSYREPELVKGQFTRPWYGARSAAQFLDRFVHQAHNAYDQPMFVHETEAAQRLLRIMELYNPEGIYPRRNNPDESLRRLERRARTGDVQAQHQLERARERLRPSPEQHFYQASLAGFAEHQGEGQFWITVNAGLVVHPPEVVTQDLIKAGGTWLAGYLKDRYRGYFETCDIVVDGEAFDMMSELLVYQNGVFLLSAVVSGVRDEDQAEQLVGAFEDRIERGLTVGYAAVAGRALVCPVAGPIDVEHEHLPEDEELSLTGKWAFSVWMLPMILSYPIDRRRLQNLLSGDQ